MEKMVYTLLTLWCSHGRSKFSTSQSRLFKIYFMVSMFEVQLKQEFVALKL